MISRVQKRDLMRVVRDYMGPDCGHVIVRTDGETFCASEGWPTDEGWARRYVSAQVHPDAEQGKRLYYVDVTDTGRDCDGPYSSTAEYRVRPVAKRKRWYWGSPRAGRGKFNLRAAWATRTERSSQRDAYAERAGY